jgi:hypothetical protein
MAPWLFATSTSVRCARWLCADRNPPLFAQRIDRPVLDYVAGSSLMLRTAMLR